MTDLPFEMNTAPVNGANIKIVGIGGGGSNAVNNMIADGVNDVQYIVANTDAQALKESSADVKVQIGEKLTGGRGAGSIPENGQKAAEESMDTIKETLQGADMVVITAGMGGGTGTGAAPIVAAIAKEIGALTVAVVTRPFKLEGPKRSRYAAEGLQKLEDHVDALIIVDNQRLLDNRDRRLSMKDAFHEVDNVVTQGIRGISDLITKTGLINLDFADVKTVMKDAGPALMGVGIASGENRAADATRAAISSPLLEADLRGAENVLLSIIGSEDMSLFEAEDAVNVITEAAGQEVNVVWGVTFDDSMKDDVRVAVIATGLQNQGQNGAGNRTTVAQKTNVFGGQNQVFNTQQKVETPVEKQSVFAKPQEQQVPVQPQPQTTTNNDPFADWDGGQNNSRFQNTEKQEFNTVFETPQQTTTPGINFSASIDGDDLDQPPFFKKR